MAVLVGGRDNVVSISAAESMKMLAFSLVWGSWIVVKNAAVRAISPLFSNGGGHGDDADGDDQEAGAEASDDDAVATATTVATASGKTARPALRDRPPPCLSTTVYGTHSYVKVKVPFY